MTYLKHSLLVAAVCAMTTGCNTPNPRINPYAGFGSPRVAPPGTGSYAVPNSYYPSTSPPATTGSASWLPNNNVAPAGTVPETFVGQIWKAPNVGSAAGFASNGNATVSGRKSDITSPLTSPPNYSSVYSVPTSQSAPRLNFQAVSGVTQLNPMPVNDATMRGVPSNAIPAGSYVDISQLPNASQPPYVPMGAIRGLTPGTYLPVNPQHPTASPIATYAPADSVMPASAIQPVAPAAQPSASLGWKPKYTPDASGGTIIR